MKILLLTIFIAALFSQPQNNADKIVGTWLTPLKEGKIEIYKSNGKYYGKIVWLHQKYFINGQWEKDIKNPVPELRKNSSMGLVILKDFVYDADDEEWEDGTIYDPKNGSTYSCYMKLENENLLYLRGYIGISWIGRTEYWSRVK